MKEGGPRDSGILVFLLLILLAGCGGSHSGTVPEWRLEQELSISSRGDGDEALTAVPFLTVDSRGNIYVAQPQDRLVKVFSSDGEFLRALGRSGEGPGEFGGIDAVGIRSDTLYVSDVRNRRVTFFDPEGSFLRTAPSDWSVIDGLFGPWRVSRILDDGDMLVDPLYGSPNVASGRISHRPLLKMDWDGNVLDTLAEISVQNSVLAVVGDGRGLLTSQPFNDSPILGFSRAGDFVVILARDAATSRSTAAMHLFKISASGDTVVSVDVPYEPEPFLTETFETAVGELAEDLVESGPFGSTSQAKEAIRQAIYHPAYLPPASALVVAQDDRVWIRREERHQEEARWEVLSPEGVPIGRVSLPASARISFATRTHLWTIESDHLDVPYVVRYRVLES